MHLIWTSKSCKQRSTVITTFLTLVFSGSDKKTFGKDKLLGHASVSIWDYIQPETGVLEAPVTLSVGSEGTLELLFDWTAEGISAPPSGRISPDSPASIKSRSRFSAVSRFRERSGSSAPSTPSKMATANGE